MVGHGDHLVSHLSHTLDIVHRCTGSGACDERFPLNQQDSGLRRLHLPCRLRRRTAVPGAALRNPRATSRLPSGTLILTIWNIACALAPNVGALLVFHLFAGISGSGPVTMGAGSVADMFAREERGSCHGYLQPRPAPWSCYWTHRWWIHFPGTRLEMGFWLSAIVSEVAVILVFLLSESYEPVLLRQKATRMRRDNKSVDVTGQALKLGSKNTFIQSITRPTKLLFLTPNVALFSLYTGVVFCYLYLLFTTVTEVYETTYHFSQGATGLAFISIGVGALVGISGFEPEFRLPPLIPGSFLIPIGLFWYGWSAQPHVYWIMPMIGLGWVDCGMIATILPIQAYLVDAFGEYAASAIAANTVVRSIVGAFCRLPGPSMYAKLGLGWGNSLLG
ncbi:unnamed protein product [Clonostachys rosea f. rosea IK726]|uniref:Uncharacterized protein n=1 Tax=Clonostachys rosea f. rosea IK726 TaxID=1349383 RepID=A0ACA9UUY0_BIOOC|nr:unnamed protein product [Clonostachys rosea f. rosea IK726]